MAQREFITFGKIIPKNTAQTRARPSFVCPHCQHTVTGASRLDEHIIRWHTKDFPYYCSHCSKGFVLPRELERHVQQKHPDIAVEKKEMGLECDVCQAPFPSLPALRAHRRSHARKYSCKQCPFSTEVKSRLSLHLQIHAGERPFRCELCNKAFGRPGHLRTHLRVHTGERPYVCGTCGYSCNRRDNLNKHERMHCNITSRSQTQSDERSFQCELCNKVFGHKGHLRTHLRIHTGERPYVCDTCGFSCNRRDNLNKHKRTHGKVIP